MKAVVFNGRRASEPFSLREVAPPSTRTGEVLVRVRCASVNALDYRSASMGILQKGKIPGADIAGVVVATGDGARRFKPGDEVIGDLSASGLGGFAELAVAPETLLAAKPAGVSFRQAAALPVAATTALQALQRAGRIEAGQKILIYGASGGVGTFAIQIARLLGAKVTAVCSEKNVGQALSLGAELALDYREADAALTGKAYDLLIAVNGNRSALDYWRALKPGGALVTVGGSLGQIASAALFGPWLTLFGKRTCLLTAKPDRAALDMLAGWVCDGLIQPVIERVYPLSDAAEAIRYLNQGHASGKVVLTMDDEGNP